MESRPQPFFVHDGLDWSERLSIVTRTMQEMSRLEDPQAAMRCFSQSIRKLVPIDRTVAVSRRDLSRPLYRITRSDLWLDQPNPWTEPHRLPVLSDGLLGTLLYEGQPRIIDDIAPLLRAGDPAHEHLDGMRSLVAIPHFDQGAAINMVIHLRRPTGAFSRDEFPEFMLLSDLFGRAMRGLVLAGQLRETEHRLQEQLSAVSSLSDTVLQQALALKSQTRDLEERIRERTAELREANFDTLYMLAIACEAKDQDTGRHLTRIQCLARDLAVEIGIAADLADAVGRAAIVHDVGKMHVPDEILKKPGPLTPEERQVMQQHTVAGERILSGGPFFATARRIARNHHENWDGSGYPDGLAGHAIPLEARIVHIVDVFDALVNERVYKPAWPVERAVAEIGQQAGRHFDPELVDAFGRIAARGGV